MEMPAVAAVSPLHRGVTRSDCGLMPRYRLTDRAVGPTTSCPTKKESMIATVIEPSSAPAI
jgi:hypothetical protein